MTVFATKVFQRSQLTRLHENHRATWGEQKSWVSVSRSDSNVRCAYYARVKRRQQIDDFGCSWIFRWFKMTGGDLRRNGGDGADLPAGKPDMRDEALRSRNHAGQFPPTKRPIFWIRAQMHVAWRQQAKAERWRAVALVASPTIPGIVAFRITDVVIPDRSCVSCRLSMVPDSPVRYEERPALSWLRKMPKFVLEQIGKGTDESSLKQRTHISSKHCSNTVNLLCKATLLYEQLIDTGKWIISMRMVVIHGGHRNETMSYNYVSWHRGTV